MDADNETVVNGGEERKDMCVIDLMKRARVLHWEDVDLTEHTNLDGRVNKVISLNADGDGNPLIQTPDGELPDFWLRNALRNHNAIHLIHPDNHHGAVPKKYTFKYYDIAATGLDMNMARVVSG